MDKTTKRARYCLVSLLLFLVYSLNSFDDLGHLGVITC